MSYPLITRRLVIEPLVEADVAEFLAYRRDPEVARWQSWTPDYTAADARRLIAGQPTTVLPGPGSWLQLAIRARDGSPLHGDVAIHRLDGQPDTFEIGVTLAPQSQGLGLATEAVATVLDFLFAEGHAHRVVAFCDSRNDKVHRLLERVGMRHESRLVEGEFFKDEWTTLDGYAILATEHAPADVIDQ
jgi:Acetyltransferases, including N-acetylases of ribosomal proteins